eukprot:TRINITY_DN12947_c0_g1_i1.p1 TRINITY_DN12947_c0_g1~~TRINITY_DN12947_c0_g1_i1.p1  ORF type:complete len:148 (+),score=36.21 TRINITY_DN12947_c0_g1_i1:132-575(+)
MCIRDRYQRRVRGRMETVQWRCSAWEWAWRGDLGSLRYMHGNGTHDMSAPDPWGRTVLHYAADAGHLDMVRWILENTQLRSEPDAVGGTALVYARLNEHAEVCDVLRAAGLEDDGTVNMVAGPELQSEQEAVLEDCLLYTSPSPRDS